MQPDAVQTQNKPFEFRVILLVALSIYFRGKRQEIKSTLSFQSLCCVLLTALKNAVTRGCGLFGFESV